MDSDLLTFQSPQTDASAAVLALPSPTVELAYAYFALLRPANKNELPWQKQLYLEQPKWLTELREFWQPDQRGDMDFDLFYLVCAYGYARDTSVQRLFADVSKCIPDFIVQLEAQMQQWQPQNLDPEKVKKMYHTMLERLQLLKNKRKNQNFVRLLKELWAWLEPKWDGEGASLAGAASQAFLEKFKDNHDVLAALPAHHFVQFEASAQTIRKAFERGSVVVIPLFFATSGGICLEIAGQQFIGYGIQTENVHQQLALEVGVAAGRVKALADPTRLMLLTLLARYDNFEMSVSDFANQLGVSQPTVSGHIKLLREAGFVTLEKKGNKSLYQVDQAAIQAVFEEVKAFVAVKK